MKASADVQPSHIQDFSAFCPQPDEDTGWLGHRVRTAFRERHGVQGCRIFGGGGEVAGQKGGNALAANSPHRQSKPEIASLYIEPASF